MSIGKLLDFSEKSENEEIKRSANSKREKCPMVGERTSN